MRKKRRLTKLFSGVLALLVLFASFSLFACNKQQEKREIYLLATDYFDNEYRIKQGEMLLLEYDRPLDAHYWWGSVDAYYCDTNEKYEEEAARTFEDTNVRVSIPDEYICIQHYPKIDVSFYAVVRVNENRPLPDFEFIPGDDCVDFVKNEKYVYPAYRFGLNRRVPDFRLTYQGEDLGYYRENENFYIVEILKYNGSDFVEEYPDFPGGIPFHPYHLSRGLYQIAIAVDRWHLPGKHYETFREIRKTILIELI